MCEVSHLAKQHQRAGMKIGCEHSNSFQYGLRDRCGCLAFRANRVIIDPPAVPLAQVGMGIEKRDKLGSNMSPFHGREGAQRRASVKQCFVEFVVRANDPHP